MKTFDGYSKEKFSDTSVLLAGGGSKELSNFIGTLNWDSTNRKLQYKKIGDTNWSDLVTFGSNATNSTAYLPLAGGTMTGAITRYYSAASSDPMISLTSNNLDVWLWRINSGSSASTATSANYGFGLKYIGTGNNNANNLVLYTDNQVGSQVAAMTVDQSGAFTFANTVNATTFSGSLSGNASSATKLTSSAGSAVLPIYFSDGKPIACTAYSELLTALSSSMDTNLSITVGGTTKSITKLRSGYLKIHDIRGTAHAPNATYYPMYLITAWFNNTGTPTSDWHSGIHVKGWGNTYTSWEVCSYSSTGTANNYNLYFRSGNNTTWGSWKTILDSSNYSSYALPLSGGTMLGDLYCNACLYGPIVGNNPRNRYDSGLYFFNCNDTTVSDYNFGLYQWDNEFLFTYRTSSNNLWAGNAFTIQGSNGQVSFTKIPVVNGSTVAMMDYSNEGTLKSTNIYASNTIDIPYSNGNSGSSYMIGGNTILRHSSGGLVISAANLPIHFRPGGTSSTTCMYLNTSGLLGLNTSSPSERLHVIGNILASGNITGVHFYESSDIRQKTDFSTLTISTKELSTIPLFDFSWKEDLSSRNTGTSAQAVQSILPNLVTESGDYLKLDYGVLGTIAGITACKELVTLKSEIDLLKERIKELERQLKMINDYGKFNSD